jgi:hypothetical protein
MFYEGASGAVGILFDKKVYTSKFVFLREKAVMRVGLQKSCGDVESFVTIRVPMNAACPQMGHECPNFATHVKTTQHRSAKTCAGLYQIVSRETRAASFVWTAFGVSGPGLKKIKKN